MIDDTDVSPGDIYLTIGDIGRVCHEANRALQIVLGEEPSAHWDDADDDMRSSTINGVMEALDGATPENLHEIWVAAKAEQGWVNGETKDPVARTHPCMMPYEDLPKEQKLKDHLFAAIVGTIAAIAGNDNEKDR